MTKSLLPKFGVTTIDSAAHSTANPRLAATIYAFDVPLHESNPYTTSAGDGIVDVRVVWNFAQTDKAGNSPAEIAAKWIDTVWMQRNETHPLAICRSAFSWHAKLKEMIEHGRGWDRKPQNVAWCFHQAAAADAALYEDAALYTKLPDASISYAKGAILGHERMVAAIKNIQFARVEHRGRVALIGRDCAGEKLNQLEKILYRK